MNIDQEQINLIAPTLALKAAFLDMLDEHAQASETYYNLALAHQDFAAYLQKLAEVAQGINLPPHLVPMTTYWLLKNNQVVLGESRLRHFLTPALEHHGGHIGYVIRPTQRQKGYGTLILALTLAEARRLGLKRIRLTCDTDNVGSVRIIEKNGGVLADQVISERSGKRISQYWITV